MGDWIRSQIRSLKRSWRKFRRRFVRAYWVKLLVFALLSITLGCFAYIFAPSPASEILFDFAVTFGAVGALQVLWDFLGGEPLELRIDELEKEVMKVQSSATLLPSIIDGIDGMKDEMRDIESSLGVLVHLADSKVGIERIWAERGEWQHEPRQLAKWHERVCKAKKVDIVSNTFWSNWMTERKFREALFERVKSEDCERVRILIYKPGSPAQQLRAEDERDGSGQMESEIRLTLDELLGGWKALPASDSGKLQVGLTHSSLHPAQIIRADNHMVVATYLTGEGGSPSPTMQLRGPESSYFQKYAKQIETLWERAKIVDAKQLEQMLR